MLSGVNSWSSIFQLWMMSGLSQTDSLTSNVVEWGGKTIWKFWLNIAQHCWNQHDTRLAIPVEWFGMLLNCVNWCFPHVHVFCVQHRCPYQRNNIFTPENKRMFHSIGSKAWWQSNFVQHLSSSFSRVAKPVQNVQFNNVLDVVEWKCLICLSEA